MIAILLAAKLLATITSGTSSIGGMGMPDKWGNPWLEIEVREKHAYVSIFDCAGIGHTIGEVPNASLGTRGNFIGFQPYMNASLADLTAVFNMAKWEKNCWDSSNLMQACPDRPERGDCRVVETPTNRGLLIPQDAWQAYQKLHHGKP